MEITDELVDKITAEVRRRLEAQAPPASAAGVPAGAAARRRVLTEAEVRAACPVAGGPGQTLVLGPGDFLTPLARDYVLSLKLNLSRG